jgi:hypothetical protein
VVTVAVTVATTAPGGNGIGVKGTSGTGVGVLGEAQGGSGVIGSPAALDTEGSLWED